MYILVNEDLHMRKGKIAGQVGHGVASVIRMMERFRTSVPPADRTILLTEWMDIYDKWTTGYECKVVLQSKQKEMEELLQTYGVKKKEGGDVVKNGIIALPIYDAGKTQIPQGSFTVLTFIPMLSSSVPESLKNMKLL